MRRAALICTPGIEKGCFCRRHIGGGRRCVDVEGAGSAEGGSQQGFQGCGSQEQVPGRGATSAQQAVTGTALKAAQADSAQEGR